VFFSYVELVIADIVFYEISRVLSLFKFFSSLQHFCFFIVFLSVNTTLYTAMLLSVSNAPCGLRSVVE